MSRIRVVAAVLLALALAGVAVAAEAPGAGGAAPAGQGGVTETQLFSWARSEPVGWSTGALLALVGLAGALFTVFGLIGGAVPGTAGQPRIAADMARLERLSERLEELTKENTLNKDGITAIEKAVNHLRDDVRKERWRQFGIGATLYALLGAFFAAMLARDLLQAITIGAAWTGLVGTLGLKRDHAERVAQRDATLDKILAVAKSAERTGDAVKAAGAKLAGIKVARAAGPAAKKDGAVAAAAVEAVEAWAQEDLAKATEQLQALHATIPDLEREVRFAQQL